MDIKLTVQKVSDEKLAYKNTVFVNCDLKQLSNYLILSVNGRKYIFYATSHNSTKSGNIAMTFAQRKWSGVSLDEQYNISFYNPKNIFISKLIISISFLQVGKSTLDMINSDKLLLSFLSQFCDFPLSVSQIIHFLCDSSLPPFELIIQEIYTADISSFISSSDTNVKADFGILAKGTQIIFKKANNNIPLNLVGKAAELAISAAPLISPNWDFNQMGIGGLDKEFSVIFRRAFASRLFPPILVHEMGLKHVRGILLYGPPGTGKTLMARQIGKMLNSREPKIVHGPDILNKYVGESEANIRKLFAEAEEEQKKMGIESGIHIIIFDEIDAICKQRGTTGGGTGVHDTVVNQLLSKIDGVEQLNNVLIIGMTNRKDLIDEALLRPGRLEVQMEISLPDENGRLQILNIHTCNLKKCKKLDSSVDLSTLAHNTKNFSGAELEGLVKAATSIAMNRAVKIDGKVKLDPKGVQNLTITMDDFNYALANDIKPMFGASTADLSLYIMNGIVNWCDVIKNILFDGMLLVEQTRNGGIISPVSLLLEGVVASGKTALAAHLALASNFPLIKLSSADQMVGYTELAKCHELKRVFDDASKSELSCIVIDNIERILEYVPIGPRFANTVLQALMVLLNKRLPNNHKLLVIATTSCMGVMEEMGVSSIFTRTLNVPQITDFSEIRIINNHYNFFNLDVMEDIEEELKSVRILVPLKKLLSIFEMAGQTSQISSPKSKFIQLMREERYIK